MSFTPDGHVIRFEIPGYGITRFRPVVFAQLFAENDHKTPEEIISELMDMGWDYYVMDKGMARDVSLIEWIAILGESTGKGLA